jgi:hypothetical protein
VIDVLRRAGAEVVVCSVEDGRKVRPGACCSPRHRASSNASHIIGCLSAEATSHGAFQLKPRHKAPLISCHIKGASQFEPRYRVPFNQEKRIKSASDDMVSNIRPALAQGGGVLARRAHRGRRRGEGHRRPRRAQ